MQCFVVVTPRGCQGLTVKGFEHLFHHWEAITITTHELTAAQHSWGLTLMLNNNNNSNSHDNSSENDSHRKWPAATGETKQEEDKHRDARDWTQTEPRDVYTSVSLAVTANLDGTSVPGPFSSCCHPESNTGLRLIHDNLCLHQDTRVCCFTALWFHSHPGFLFLSFLFYSEPIL